MIERLHIVGGKEFGQIVSNEATIRIRTPKGCIRCKPGTMFHEIPPAPGFLMPIGSTMGGEHVTQESGYGNVLAHVSENQESMYTYENSASLRLKIVQAENRLLMRRGIVIGMVVGAFIQLTSTVLGLLPFVP